MATAQYENLFRGGPGIKWRAGCPFSDVAVAEPNTGRRMGSGQFSLPQFKQRLSRGLSGKIRAECIEGDPTLPPGPDNRTHGAKRLPVTRHEVLFIGAATV